MFDVRSASDWCVSCRPGRIGPSASGRGVLSMQGLSYGVVRVDTPNSLTSLTLQDCGQVLPGGRLHHSALCVSLFCILSAHLCLSNSSVYCQWWSLCVVSWQMTDGLMLAVVQPIPQYSLIWVSLKCYCLSLQDTYQWSAQLTVNTTARSHGLRSAS